MDSEEKSRVDRDQRATADKGASTGTRVNQKRLDEIEQTEKEKKPLPGDFTSSPGGGYTGTGSGAGFEGLWGVLLALGGIVGVVWFFQYIESSYQGIWIDFLINVGVWIFLIAVLIGLVLLVFWGIKNFLTWCTESTGGLIFILVCACGFALTLFVVFYEGDLPDPLSLKF